MLVVADFTSSTYATSTAESTISLADDSYVTISASDVVMSITPDSTGNATATTTTTETAVTVTTNSTNPVNLQLSMTGNSNSLYLDGNTSNSSIVATAGTTNDPVSLDNLGDDAWGFSLDGEDYAAVPTSDAPVAISSSISSTSSSDTTTSTVTLYYGLSITSSLTAGTYSNSVVYTATVSSEAIAPTATITNIKANGINSDTMLVDKTNVITVTTNIKTNTHGEPRVYYVINDGENSPTYQECSTAQASQNNEGYLQIVCTVTPTTAAVAGEATLYITTKGSSDDYYCTEGIYSADSSDCEAGNWKWGTFEIKLPEIKEGSNNVFGITYMQEMTTDICDAAEVDTTAQLIDIRDGKTYWVAKLKDGNCWMTQNLDYDLGNNSSGSSVTLDADTSNITSGSSTTFTAYFYTSAADGTATSSYVQTWDLGQYVIINPTSISSSAYCGGSGAYALDNSNCTSYFTDVSKLTARNYITDYSGTSTATVDDTSYDAHYLVGNYYSWNAATANSTGSGFGTATSSICPTNWTLPLSNSTDSGSFSYLLYAYDLLSSLSSSSGSVSSDNYNIASDPLYFVRGGVVTSNYHYLNYAGYYGNYWSRVAYSSSYAYSLLFSSSADPSSYSLRYLGRSVRCVVVVP